MKAAWCGHDAVVQLFLDKGADIEAKNNVSLTRNYLETIILGSAYYTASVILPRSLMYSDLSGVEVLCTNSLKMRIVMILRDSSIVEWRNRSAVGFQVWSFFRRDITVLPRGQLRGPEQGKELFVCIYSLLL